MKRSTPQLTSNSTKEGIISLYNPHRQVEMMREEEKRFRKVEEERSEFGRWDIRSELLIYVPAEIKAIQSLQFLRHLYAKYYLPALKPLNVEELTFVQIMSETIHNRMTALNSVPFEES